MEITLEWLAQNGACSSGRDWFVTHDCEGMDHSDLYRKLMEHGGCGKWACWLLGHIGGVEFAVRCALEICDISPWPGMSDWREWADRWMSGEDRTAKSAWEVHRGWHMNVGEEAANFAALAAVGGVDALSIADAATWAAEAVLCGPHIHGCGDIDLLRILEECSSWK
jgi:hypothetical protein